MKRILINNNLFFMLISLLLFLLLAIFYKGEGTLTDSSKILLTVTSFVFGFYINNLISQSRSRHSKVVESLREEGGYIKAIYYIVQESFSDKETDRIRSAVDNYLMASMDYNIVDYSLSAPEYRKLFSHIMSIDPKTKKEENSWNHLVRVSAEISKNRNRIETLVKERISLFEWLTVTSLLLLVIFFIFSTNNGVLVSVLITSFLSTALTMLIIILKSLDSLRWKEDKWFWEPLAELFVSLDLVPYFPRILIKKGRLKIKKNKPVRLVDYPNKYPDMSGKRITLQQQR